MKKILFLTATLSDGGAQRAFANLSIELEKRGIECTFLLDSDDPSKITYDYAGRLLSVGLDPKKNSKSLSYQIEATLKRIKVLKKLKESGEFDACISGLTVQNAINALTKSSRCKTITNIQNFMSHKNKKRENLPRWVKKWMIGYFPNRSDSVVCVSEGVKIDMIQNFGLNPNKAVTIYNGFASSVIEERAVLPLNSDEEAWFADDKFTWVTHARLEWQKGQWHLLRAFAALSEKRKDVKLIIVGEGSLRAELEGLIRDMNLEDKVILAGHRQNPINIIKHCDAYIMPSLFEGFSLSILEVMAVGIPMVSTDCNSGPREVCAPGTDVSALVTDRIEVAENGILTPVCDGIHHGNLNQHAITKEEALMVQAMEILMDDKALQERFSENGKKKIMDFEMNQCTSKWMDLF